MNKIWIEFEYNLNRIWIEFKHNWKSLNIQLYSNSIQILFKIIRIHIDDHSSSTYQRKLKKNMGSFKGHNNDPETGLGALFWILMVSL